MWQVLIATLTLTPTCTHNTEAQKIWCETILKRYELNDKRALIEDELHTLERKHKEAEELYLKCENQSWRAKLKSNMQELESQRKRLECAHYAIRGKNEFYREINRKLEEDRKNIEKSYAERARDNIYTEKIANLSIKYNTDYFEPMHINLEENYHHYINAMEDYIDLIKSFNHDCESRVETTEFIQLAFEKHERITNYIVELYNSSIFSNQDLNSKQTCEINHVKKHTS